MATICHINGLESTGKSFGVQFLDPKTTFYFDLDKKGLPYTGWKKSYNEESKNYLRTSDLSVITKALKGISANAPHIKTVVLDTLTGALTDKMMAESKKPGFDK